MIHAVVVSRQRLEGRVGECEAGELSLRIISAYRLGLSSAGWQRIHALAYLINCFNGLAIRGRQSDWLFRELAVEVVAVFLAFLHS